MPVYINFDDATVLASSNMDVYIISRTSPGMGDAVMIMQAITGVRKKIGSKAVIIVAGLEYVNTVFEHNDCIDFILPYTSEQVSALIDNKQMKSLANSGAIIYNLYNPCPCGVHEYENRDNTDKIKPRVEIFAEACGVEFDIDNYNFVLHPNDLDASLRLGLPERYVVLGMRTSMAWKDYRYIKWFARKLADFGKKSDFAVITMDESLVVPTNRYPVTGIHGLVNQKLTDLYGVIANSLMTVSCDSGYAHVAGALGVPVFGIYGPTPPRVFLKYKQVSWLPKFRKCPRQYCWYWQCKLRPCLCVHPNKVVGEIQASMKGFALI